MSRSVAGRARFTTVPSRKTTIDTMIATTMTRLIGATSRNFTSDPALRTKPTKPIPGDGCAVINAASSQRRWMSDGPLVVHGLFSLKASDRIEPTSSPHFARVVLNSVETR